MTVRNHFIKNDLSNLKNEFIVFLSFAQVFFSALIYPFKYFQHVIEVFLICFFITGIYRTNFLKWEIYLVGALFISLFFAFINFDFFHFLSVFKENLLGILALIYFNKVKFKSKIIIPFFFISLFLFLISKLQNDFAKEFINTFISMSSDTEFNLSRFGGLFLNAHFNALFLSIVIIYLGYNRIIYNLIGVYLINTLASKFILIAYIYQIIVYRLLFFFKKEHIRYWMFFLFFLITVFYVYKDYFLYYFHLFNINNYYAFNSLYIIMYQLFSFDYLNIIFNIFPGFYDLRFPPIVTNGIFHDGDIEIGFLALVSKSGTFLAAYYIYLINKTARNFTIFILVSLLHNNYIMLPIIIYLLIMYSREIDIIRGSTKHFDLNTN
jgi:hypothetical protein